MKNKGRLKSYLLPSEEVEVAEGIFVKVYALNTAEINALYMEHGEQIEIAFKSTREGDEDFFTALTKFAMANRNDILPLIQNMVAASAKDEDREDLDRLPVGTIFKLAFHVIKTSMAADPVLGEFLRVQVAAILTRTAAAANSFQATEIFGDY